VLPATVPLWYLNQGKTHNPKNARDSSLALAAHGSERGIHYELRALDDLNYARLEAKLEQLVAELRTEMRLARLDAALDGFETRMTRKFFHYFAAQGVTTAAIIIGL